MGDGSLQQKHTLDPLRLHGHRLRLHQTTAFRSTGHWIGRSVKGNFGHFDWPCHRTRWTFQIRVHSNRKTWCTASQSTANFTLTRGFLLQKNGAQLGVKFGDTSISARLFRPEWLASSPKKLSFPFRRGNFPLPWPTRVLEHSAGNKQTIAFD